MNLIECVPNVSEGRRQAWVAAIADELPRYGVALLDFSADASHNRSVFTMAGASDALRQAVLFVAERAIAAIDLRSHHGVHPRVGALDVVPFVPLAGTPMAACVTLARDVGRELADRFSLPVYLYEEASLRPDRRRLEVIRRGGLEGLAARMAQPEWTPDFGPSTPHPSAGASVVGARQVLIAYNVNLASDDLALAQRIARRIRESSGGLPCVKAMGVRLDHRGLVQVSMNLTDYTRTPPVVAFDRIAGDAARHGVDVLESELIGLIPEAALAGTSAAHLKLAGFTDDRILEVRLRQHGLR